MKFPVIVLKEKESPIYYFNHKTFALVSKRGETFYASGIIFDSSGNKHILCGIESITKAPIGISIRYFQPMFRVSVKSKLDGVITIDRFKQLVIDHIRLFKEYWITRDTINGLESSILAKNEFEEIINFLK